MPDRASISPPAAAPRAAGAATRAAEGAAGALTPGYQPAGPALPERVGEFRIRGLLGVGGMGVVYDAEQEHPHRRVALKVIRDAGLHPDALRRFARESDVLARLQHPGIAQIYAAGTAEGPHGEAQPYFAMERVDGRPLAAYAAGLDRRGRLELFARVCDAMNYAHQRGVIHRDLKPANVLVDEAGQPKILDFGVARLTDADMQGTRATATGEVVGTLQYMSPEQLGGDPLAVDTRSDVYALGVILYELLAGRRPYDLTGRQLLDAARTILTVDPPPLGAADRRLRGDLETIAAKALDKEPTRRYASAAGLAADVRRYLADEPITARPASAVYHLRKLARRHRAVVAGAATALAALAAGAVASAWSAVRARAAERVAVAERADAVAARRLAERRGADAGAASVLAERRRAEAEAGRALADSARRDAVRAGARAVASARQAREEAAKATAVSGFLTDMLGAASPDVALGRALTVREVLDSAARRVSSSALVAQPAVRGEVLAALGLSYRQLGAYDEALRHYDSAYAIGTRLRGAEDPAVARTARLVGEVYHARGDLAAARGWYERALAVQRRRLAPDDDELVRTLANLAHATYTAGEFARAEALHRDAAARARRRHPNGDPVVVKAESDLADFLLFTNRPQAAESLWRAVLPAAERLRGATHPEVSRALLGLASALANAGRHAEAEPFARRAHAMDRTIYGERHVTTAVSLSRLARIMRHTAPPAAAESTLRRVVALWESMYGERHTEVFLARTNLARMLDDRGAFAEAESLYVRTLAGRRAFYGEASPAVTSSITDLGQLALRRGDPAGAERWLRDALPRWRGAGIGAEAGWTEALLGVAAAARGRLAEADSLLRRGVTGMGGPDRGTHSGLPVALDSLGGVARRLGRLTEADTAYTAAAAVRRRLSGPRNVAVAGPLGRLADLRLRRGDTTGALAPLRESVVLLRSAGADSAGAAALRQRQLDGVLRAAPAPP
jgi:tetratricopeptide (TPR) repeat protein/predicted Ser/Thr protein kinase